MHTDKLEQFIGTVMSIEVGIDNIVGGALPGTAGSSIIQRGTFNSGMDVTVQLKRQVMAFAKACRTRDFSHDKIVALAKEVESGLLNEELLSVITHEQSETLISQLYDLVDDAR